MSPPHLCLLPLHQYLLPLQCSLSVPPSVNGHAPPLMDMPHLLMATPHMLMTPPHLPKSLPLLTVSPPKSAIVTPRLSVSPPPLTMSPPPWPCLLPSVRWTGGLSEQNVPRDRALFLGQSRTLTVSIWRHSCWNVLFFFL